MGRHLFNRTTTQQTQVQQFNERNFSYVFLPEPQLRTGQLTTMDLSKQLHSEEGLTAAQKVPQIWPK